MLLRGILNSMTKEVPIVSLNGVVVFFFFILLSLIIPCFLARTAFHTYTYRHEFFPTTKYTVNIFVEYTFYSSQYRLM